MVSIRATVMVITLLTLCLLATNASAASYGCCRSYMIKKIPSTAIRGYSVQTITQNCPINAIIFHLKRGGRACTNPAMPWVMEYINNLKNKAQIVHIKSLLDQK